MYSIRNIKLYTQFTIYYFKECFNTEILPELFGYDYEPYTNESIKFDKGSKFYEGWN